MMTTAEERLMVLKLTDTNDGYDKECQQTLKCQTAPPTNSHMLIWLHPKPVDTDAREGDAKLLILAKVHDLCLSPATVVMIATDKMVQKLTVMPVVVTLSWSGAITIAGVRLSIPLALPTMEATVTQVTKDLQTSADQFGISSEMEGKAI